MTGLVSSYRRAPKLANKTLQPTSRAQRWFQSDSFSSRGLRLNVKPLGVTECSLGAGSWNHASFKSRPSELIRPGRHPCLLPWARLTCIHKRNRRLLDIFLYQGETRQHRTWHPYHLSITPMTQSLLPSLASRGLVARPSRAADFGGRRALFEPFEKTQDRLREFARRRSRLHDAGHPKGHATATMVLGPFAETKGPRSPGRNPAIPNITWTP